MQCKSLWIKTSAECINENVPTDKVQQTTHLPPRAFKIASMNE